MKESVKVRIVEFKNEFYVDYCKIGKKLWKNHSVNKTKTKAKNSINDLKGLYSIINHTYESI